MKKIERMQKGSVLVLFAVLLPVFVFFVAVVVDLARAQAHRSYLQNIADAAALAGVNTIAHTQGTTARVVPEGPDGNTVTTEGSAIERKKAEDEAKSIIKSNTGLDSPFANVDMLLLKSMVTDTHSDYYYRVTIEDHVPLLLARAFLPDDVLPDGIPVPPIVAWATVRHNLDSLYSMLYDIGQKQIVKDNATLKLALNKDNSRAEHVHENGYGIYFSESDGKVIRTETIVPKAVGTTWKYLFVDFESEIVINKNGPKTDVFPFDNWDLGMDLTDNQWRWVQYYEMFGIDVNNDGIFSDKGESGSRQAVINALINQFDSIKTEEDALEVLNTPITNVVSFSALSKVRGGIENIPDNTESNLELRRQKLEEFEDHGKFNAGLKAKEIKIAGYTGNDRLGDLVARSADGSHISAYDPLLVKIESEDINKNLSASNNNLFYATSVRELTIKIDANNTDDQYRPLIIYYYGPEDIDGKTSDMGGKRESRLVTLELNADFKGILFAPNSPVTIKSNGHKIKGLVVAKSYQIWNEEEKKFKTISGNFASAFFGGDYNNKLTFSDFDMLDLSGGSYTANDVIITSVQAMDLK